VPTYSSRLAAGSGAITATVDRNSTFTSPPRLRYAVDYADLAAAGSADAFCQPDQNALGASDVTEAIHVFVLDDFVDELRVVLAEPGERIVEIVHGEHDAKIAECVHPSVR
jgi:hypothetical protein